MQNHNTPPTHQRESFPKSRQSRSAQQSFEAELNRLRAMSTEERVLEALGMKDRFAGMKFPRKDA